MGGGGRRGGDDAARGFRRGHCGNILGVKTRNLNLSSWQVTKLEMQWQCCQHIAISIVRTFLPMEQ